LVKSTGYGLFIGTQNLITEYLSEKSMYLTRALDRYQMFNQFRISAKPADSELLTTTGWGMPWLLKRGRMDQVMEDPLMDTSDLRTLTELLDFDDFEVVDVASDRGGKLRRLTVTPTRIAELCPHCGGATGERHVCHDRKVMDLPLGGWKTELVVRLFQFHCERCEKFFTPRYPVLAEGAHATERFLERLAEYASHSDVSAAARFLGVAEKTAENWYYEFLERRKEPAKDLLPIRSLGIDELSLKKDIGSSAAC